MEVELNKSGLKNLDPMAYWKYVMAVKRGKPCVVIFDIFPEELEYLAKKYPLVDFVIEAKDYDDIPKGQTCPNIIYRWRDNLSEKEWLNRWRWTDCLLCNENVLEYWIRAKLCGVKCVFDISDLNDFLENAHVLNSIERIENWEYAKSLLTHQKTCAIL